MMASYNSKSLLILAIFDFFSQNLLIPASPKIPQGVKYANTHKLYTTNADKKLNNKKYFQ